MHIRPEHNLRPVKNPFLKQIYRVIYFADTPMGKLFDIFLLVLIVISTSMVMIETVPWIQAKYHIYIFRIEFFITILFTIEYFLRIITVKDKREYIFSTLGILDLLAIVPFLLSIFFPVLHYFAVIRMFRMLRIFRIFNLADYMDDSQYIMSAMRNSSRKIYIFLLFISVFIIFIGCIMFVVEDGQNGFTSIPQSIYWAVVTITTVGYGDVSPTTGLGKFISIIVMLCGYSIIAVPTGIVTSELKYSRRNFKKPCNRCGNEEVDGDARFCKKCGEKLV